MVFDKLAQIFRNECLSPFSFKFNLIFHLVPHEFSLLLDKLFLTFNFFGLHLQILFPQLESFNFCTHLPFLPQNFGCVLLNSALLTFHFFAFLVDLVAENFKLCHIFTHLILHCSALHFKMILLLFNLSQFKIDISVLLGKLLSILLKIFSLKLLLIFYFYF